MASSVLASLESLLGEASCRFIRILKQLYEGEELRPPAKSQGEPTSHVGKTSWKWIFQTQVSGQVSEVSADILIHERT